MKRLLRTSLFTLPFALLACSSDPTFLCAFGDADCDGVPDDLGKAVLDSSGNWGLIDVNNDGRVDGYAVDTNGDGIADAALIDTDGDGRGDSLDLDGDGVADVTTGATGFTPTTPGTGGTSGNGATTGSGGGTGATDQGTGGDPFDFGDPPDLNLGSWNAPILSSAQDMLAQQYLLWKNQNLKSCPSDSTIMAVDADTNGAKVVSEAIGYGMLITAGLGSQSEFDGLWNFYKKAAKSSVGLMSWKCSDLCGSCDPNENEASDADLDVAMGLLQAEHRWGGGAYKTAALDVIAKLRAAVLKSCDGRTVFVAGNWDPSCQKVNPSYFSPGYFRVFRTVDTLGETAWNNAIDGSYELLDISKGTGSVAPLWPDATTASGSAISGFAGNGYDAARVPWRIAIDYAWSGDTRASALMTWAQGKIDASGFQAFATDSNSAFWGANALTGLSGGETKAQAYFDAWMGANMQDAAYYQGTLRLIYLMLFAGQFTSTFDTL